MVSFQTEHASIHYSPNNEQLARKVGEAYEFGYLNVVDLGYLGKSVIIYIYDSPEDMVASITTEYGREYAELMAKVSRISPLSNYRLHIFSKAKGWEKEEYLWHAVVHEYVHGLTEETFGKAIATSIRWLYEGLGEYLAYSHLKKRFKRFERRWSKSRFKVAFNSLLMGKLFSLRNITTQEQWISHRKNREWWNLQYAQAYVAVTYLIQTYGMGRCKSILNLVKNGLTSEEALQNSLGISISRFQRRIKVFLLFKGLLHLYSPRHLAVRLLTSTQHQGYGSNRKLGPPGLTARHDVLNVGLSLHQSKSFCLLHVVGPRSGDSL